MKFFTEDWFSSNIGTWSRILSHLVHKPCEYLEIGSYQGRSVIWMMENVLTHPDSRATCIDTFEGSVEHSELQKKNLFDIFTSNVDPFRQKLTIIRDKSGDAVRHITTRFDVVYIDGCHIAANVLEDAVNSFHLLKTGGIMIFDDYLGGGVEMNTPQQPKMAIDAFVSVYAPFVKLLHQGYQVMLTKLSDI